MDRDKFFAAIRVKPFGGTMTQSQVDGVSAILDAWDDADGFDDPRWLAYMLATAKWETAHTMQPIEEFGKGAGHKYGQPDPETGQTYYGRGLAQLTWKSNYAKFAALTGVDLVGHPEMALDPKIAALILFHGMKDGLFTGVGLPKYFNDHTDDPLNARRVVNGMDRAQEIASIYADFREALTGADA